MTRNKQRTTAKYNTLKKLNDTQKKLNTIITALENGIYNDTTQSCMLELESIKADLSAKIEIDKLK
ncbi:MAG: hypothetical protein LBF68_02790 [Christensenellaceae bacterium]|jgi:flagellar hook-basal body complex protein FliE|nr:hypothetical protein [Christensenellaceae bacterium]